MKKITIVLLAMGLVGTALGMGSRPAGEQAEPDAGKTAPGRVVVAYYFHGNMRCYKCTAMEAYADEAFKARFAKELESGALIWRPTNIDLPKNRHFVEDYQLVTRSLVLVEARDGKQVRWKNLPKIWDLVGDKDAFIKYVQEETEAFIKGEK